MCQLKTCMCFLFFQPIIGCPLLAGRFCPKCSRGAQKSVRYNRCPLRKCPLYRGFSKRVWPWVGGPWKKCPLLPVVRYIACPL